MWQIDTKVNNYGAAWLDMYLLELTDPVEGDADPGGVPINLADLEPSNETLYRMANNLKMVEGDLNFAGITINVTTATIASLQATLDAMAKWFPNGADLVLAFAAGSYTWPVAGITFEGFSGANTIQLWDGSTLRTGTYTSSTRQFQHAATAPTINFIDINTAKIRINGLSIFQTGNYSTLYFENCNSKVLVDSNYIDHQSNGSGSVHIECIDCPNVVFEDVSTDLAHTSIKLNNSKMLVDNSGTVAAGTEPALLRSNLTNGSKLIVAANHNYLNSLTDTLGDPLSMICEFGLLIELSTPGSASGQFTIGGDISTDVGGSGKVLMFNSDYIWVYRHTGTFAGTNNIDNVDPYVGSVDTIASVTGHALTRVIA